MLQTSEITIPIWVHGGPHSPEVPGIMYARFRDDAVHLRLQMDHVIVETPGEFRGHFLDAITEVILPNMPGMTVRQEHTVWFIPDSANRASVLKITETAWHDPIKNEGRFRLVSEWSGNTYQAEAPSFEGAMDQLAKSLPGKLQTCYTCALAAFMSYGNEDLRHGWNCFRDLNLDPTTWDRWWDYEDEFQRAIHFMSAFHWCPSHRNRVG